MTDVIVVGAGLAGLCCAKYLKKAGVSCRLIEASDDVGGRVRTDLVDGFKLDRGFQVFLTAYPEARKILDYERLHLRTFYPGALIRQGGMFHRLADPFRRVIDGLATAFSPLGSFLDKLKVAELRVKLEFTSLEQIFRAPESTTAQFLAKQGFSEDFINSFFRPFFGGVFLDRNLNTSSRQFEFVYKMMASGDIALPATGMQQIPLQLAEGLDITFNRPVKAVTRDTVTLTDGQQIKCKAVVLAVDAAQAAALTNGEVAVPKWRSVVCIYFAMPTPPTPEPILVLNGEKDGLVNNLAVLSAVSSEYAPADSSLVSVTVLDARGLGDAELQRAVLDEMRKWYGAVVDTWRHLRTYRITQALPAQEPPWSFEQPARLDSGIYVCGDYRENASINGAMASGRRAAELLLKSL